jgi:hypothetical protein
MTSPHDEAATDTSVVDDDDFMDFESKPRRTGTLTKVLASLLLVALGFLGGVTVGRSASDTAGAGAVRPASSGGGGGSSTGGTGGGAGSAGSNSGADVSQAAPASSVNGPDLGGSSRTPVVAPPTVITSRPPSANTGGSGASAQVDSNQGPVTIAPVEPPAAVNSGAVGSSGSRSSSPTAQLTAQPTG